MLEGLAIVTDEIVQPAVDDVARKSVNVVVVVINRCVRNIEDLCVDSVIQVPRHDAHRLLRMHNGCGADDGECGDEG